ncbi:clusterin-like protein 1 [Discoglossus pictus]
MKSFLFLITCLLWLKHLECVPTLDVEESLLRKKIKVISKLGEEYVQKEVQKALTGVKQMRKIMEINEEKHDNILKSLKKTTEEKLEAVSLLEDINERTNYAEMQCKERHLSVWTDCEACRERSCITFYTTNCSQEDFQSPSKDEFKKWSPLSLLFPNVDMKHVTTTSDKEALQLIQEENSFSLLVSNVSALFNQSFEFFKNIEHEFDQSFQSFFMSDIEVPDLPVTVTDNDLEIIYDFFKDWNLLEWFQSLYEFGQAIFEGVKSALSKMLKNFSRDSESYYEPLEGSPSHFGTQLHMKNLMVCKELQNFSGCLHFHERCQLCYETLMKDCPDVLELYQKFEEVLKLVNVSTQQYEDLLQIIEQHTEDTSNLINQMKEKFGWVASLANLTSGTDNIFSIEKVSFSPKSAYSIVNETVVEVNIFTHPTLTVTVPGDLDLESPKFIHFVAEEALQLYKTNF